MRRSAVAQSLPCSPMLDGDLEGPFLDQEWLEARRVIDTNVTGTVYLLHLVAR